MNKLLLFLAITLFCTSAFAADGNWYKNAACSTLMSTNNLVAGTDVGTNNAELMYNCFGASTGSTEVFQAKSYFKFCFDTDSGSAATGTARVQLKQCMSSTASANTCSDVYVDRDGNGVLDTAAMDGTVGTTQNRCTYDLPPGFYHAEFTVARTASEAPLIQIQVQK